MKFKLVNTFKVLRTVSETYCVLYKCILFYFLKRSIYLLRGGWTKGGAEGKGREKKISSEFLA